jgi:hypothetical protein
LPIPGSLFLPGRLEIVGCATEFFKPEAEMKTPWAVILCKFADGDDEPFPLQRYKNMFTTSNTGSKWNMIKYFSEYSHGKLDLTGTQIFGWFKLNQSVADYNGPNGGRTQLIKWARKAATDNGVDLGPFFSTIVCCNRWKDIGSVGSGVVSQGPLTLNPQLLGHEMGHVYGMNHSRIDGSTTDYMDPWDIMSAANVFSASDAEYGPIGPGVNAWNMRSRGWLDESRVWKVSCNFDQEVKLRPLVRHDLNGFLAAEMPGGYLVEFRMPEGWDGGIPRPAVLLHRFDGANSYLMQGNSGSSDLVAGDSFGSEEPSKVDSLFHSFHRLDVVSIDAARNEATLRLRCHEPDPLFGLTVDPMYLILSGKAYLIWVEMKHPHVPKVAEIEKILRTMSREEQNAALARAKAITEYSGLVEAAIARVRGETK